MELDAGPASPYERKERSSGGRTRRQNRATGFQYITSYCVHAASTQLFETQRKNFPQQANPFISGKADDRLYDLFAATTTTTMTQQAHQWQPLMNNLNNHDHDTHSSQLVHKSSSLQSSRRLQLRTDASMFASFFLQLCAFPIMTTWTYHQWLHLPSQVCLTVTSFLKRMRSLSPDPHILSLALILSPKSSHHTLPFPSLSLICV